MPIPQPVQLKMPLLKVMELQQWGSRPSGLYHWHGLLFISFYKFDSIYSKGSSSLGEEFVYAYNFLKFPNLKQ